MAPHTRRRPVALPALVALALAGASACDDAPFSPTRPPVPPGAATATSTVSTLPARVANRVKYRQTGKTPATGRSGSASLTVRALLGKDKETDLAVTTGTLDDGTTPPGNLDKVQLKTLDPKGNVVSAVNYNKLRSGGFASYGVLNLPRGGRIQVQANVSGIDPARSDVVTVTETVRLRPDLAVAGIEAPRRAPLATPVNIGATVVERNGDVGAWADCVLYVDGAEADRATRIWVDVFGTVSCAFTVRFRSPGTKQLTVALEGVAPGDWDTSNNSLAGSVQVSAPISPNDFFWWADATDMTFLQLQRDAWSWTYGPDPGGVTGAGNGATEVNNRGHYQSAAMSGSMPQEAAFPLAKLELRHESNGATLLAVTLEDVAPDWNYDYSDDPSAPSRERGGCFGRVSADAQTGWWYTYYSVCSSSQVVPVEFGGDGTTRYGQTSFSESRWAGDVTYHSRHYGETWYRDASGNCASDYGGCYSWNNVYADLTVTGGGPLPTLGSDYTHVLALTTGGATYTALGVVPLQTVDYFDEYFYGTSENPCVSWADSYYRGTNCYEWRVSYTNVSGTASGEPTALASP